MTGQCKDCGYICELDKAWEAYGCPICRVNRVAKAFAPIDPLRTALGMKDARNILWDELQRLRGQMGVLHTNVDWQSAEWKGVKARAEAAMNQDGTWDGVEPDAEQTEVPRGCKMPLGDAAQVYELRRRFRL